MSLATEIDPAFASAGTSLAPLQADNDDAIISGRAARASIPNLANPNDPAALTPLRAHYLKKTLIRLQMEREVAQLSTKDALSTFGPPFRASPEARRTDLPLLRFMFQHFVLTFPFLRSAPPNFFSDKVQVFFDKFLERNISGTEDRDESTKRRKLTTKLEKYFVLLMGSAIKVKAVGEDVVRISERDRAKMDAVESRRKAALGRAGAASARDDDDASSGFDINVVSVRNVVVKGRLRSRAHEEFIIRTRRGYGQPDIYVSRRYGDFEKLAETLKVEYPDEGIRPPPPKDRSNTDVADPYQKQSAAVPSQAATLQPPGIEDPYPRASTDSASSQSRIPMPTGPLAREKNRLTLRAYLRSLLASPSVAESALLMDFLTAEPTTLTRAEEEDAAIREGLDHVREEEHKRFSDEAAKRAQELQQHLKEFKQDLVQHDGLSRIFATIKSTPRIEDLPEKYKALLKWARISLASTIFHIFMGSDNSSEIFSQMKRMHGMMPYFMLRGILRISNPMAMVRGVLDIFLAQPFGQRSLLQRMFSSSLQDEVRELDEVCAAISAKVDDATICEKVRQFVYAPAEVQALYRKDADEERLDLLTTILRSPEAPMLSRSQIHRVVKASQAYEVYKEYRRGLKNPDLEDEGPQDDDAWLYEDLHVLVKMLTRKRDKEQMISLIFEGVTAELLKDMVTIFYSPLAQVYKLANIADSLSDLQAFITDLIKTVEANEELSYTDPTRTVQVFVDLVERHEGRFYNFVHQVHSKGSGLFDGLMHWIELFINFVRGNERSAEVVSQQAGTEQAVGKSGGIGEVDLEICLPAGGEERRKALDEIDSLALYAYRLKFLRELKLRRKLADREVAGVAGKLIGAEKKRRTDGLTEEDDSAFVGAMVENLGVGDIFTGEVADAEAEEDEMETSDEEDSDEGHGEDPSSRNRLRKFSRSDSEVSAEDDEEEEAPRWRPTPSRQTTLTQGNLKQLDKDLPTLPHGASADGTDADKTRKRRKIPAPKAPELKVLPEMLPLFVEMVRPLLRPARTASASSHRSASYDPYASSQPQGLGQAAAPRLPPLATTGDQLSSGMQGMDLAAISSPASYVSSPFATPRADGSQNRQEPRSDRLPGEYQW
ncbi:conserved fungal protein [Pseudozyma hubeiensis SY62]|uniref:Conserved fungal protein n=1 Tax=Pseudozyma hubeiensis (strain SY62) TaxID=1305764 RepID=R9PG19_PSEHS|nr:conserved fungal protein [Pseudozyma hubeiensis SY62]GAC97055.1 conserved fungal protein [Pseudozyma hubeiensis SY62]